MNRFALRRRDWPPRRLASRIRWWCRCRWRQARRRRIRWESEGKRYPRYHRLSDREWRQVLMDSIDGHAALPMPRFPSIELQAGFVGSSNRQAIHQAWIFYLLMADQRKKYGLVLGEDSHVLDFGCGWGRFTRMFLRDVPESNIWYADSQTLALDICRDTGVPGRMIQLPQMPPSDLPSAQFDTSFAYSVFSHLSPQGSRSLGGGVCPHDEAWWTGFHHHTAAMVCRYLSEPSREPRRDREPVA
jgi:hypothetical protein